MSDPRVALKLNLPPAVQYHSGHSLIVQGDTLREVKELLAEEVGEDRAAFIVAAFFENVLLGSVKDSLGTPHDKAEDEPKKKDDSKQLSAVEKAKKLAASKRQKGA